MANFKIVARVEEEPDGQGYLVRSPAVGVVDGVPDVGMYLNPMQGFLTMKRLGRRHIVLLPRGVQGRVAEQLVEGTHRPVEYDQPLMRLRRGAGAEAEVAVAGASAAAGGAEGADAGLIAVPAPSEGIFYRRSGPDSPPYVEVGTPVARGTVLGLVEVMKSFNQIVYGGAGLPERGVVARIEVQDAAEVAFGQPLFFIRTES